MTYSYDLQTSVGKIRMLIPDHDASIVLCTDEEIAAFLGMEGSNVKRAAALALETIASDRALVLQVISSNDLSVNGAAVAKALTDRAKMLRDQADIEDAGVDGGAFDIAEQVPNEFAFRERTWNEMLRGH